MSRNNRCYCFSLKLSEFSHWHNLTAGQLFFMVHIIHYFKHVLTSGKCLPRSWYPLKNSVAMCLERESETVLVSCTNWTVNWKSILRSPGSLLAIYSLPVELQLKEKRWQKPSSCPPVQNTSVLPNSQFYCMLSLKN